MSDLTADEYDYVYNDNNKASQFETNIDRYDEVMQRRKSSAAFKEYLAKNIKPLTAKQIQMFTGFSKMITDAKHNKEIPKMDNTMNTKIKVGDKFKFLDIKCVLPNEIKIYHIYDASIYTRNTIGSFGEMLKVCGTTITTFVYNTYGIEISRTTKTNDNEYFKPEWVISYTLGEVVDDVDRIQYNPISCDTYVSSDKGVFNIGDFVMCSRPGYYRITEFVIYINGTGDCRYQTKLKYLYNSKGNPATSKKDKVYSCSSESLAHANYQTVIINTAMKSVKETMEDERKLENMIKFEYRTSLTKALKTLDGSTPVSEVFPEVSIGEIKDLIISAMKYQAYDYDGGTIEDWQEGDIERFTFNNWLDRQDD